MGHCPHHNCRTPTLPGNYSCRPHWFALPQGIRSDIWKGFRNGLDSTWRRADVAAREYWRNREKARAQEPPKAPKVKPVKSNTVFHSPGAREYAKIMALAKKCTLCGGRGHVKASYYDPSLGLIDGNRSTRCRKCEKK